MFRKHMVFAFLAAAALAAAALSACGDDDDDGNGTPTTQAGTAASGVSETTKSALLESINEEYKAHATYLAVVDKLGDVGPFSNIVKSEQSHIDAWKNLLTKYGVAIPDDPFLGKVTAPATLKDACAAGVEAEKADVALYDRLLKTVTESDIVTVMQQQRKVSQENHLPAFERC